MQNLNVTFENDDGQSLAGLIAMPAGTPRTFALFAHCFTCSKNLKAATNISRALAEAGIAVLRFDFTGLGQSEGAFADTNFSSNVSDLLAAVRFLEQRYEAPRILLGHSLVADEPASVGGTDDGPSPYDLLSAALAACTSMTLRMYAAHKKINLDSATVRVSHGKIHAKDCEDCESKEGRVDEFRRELLLEGSFSAPERQRMLEIADRCPVHQTLHGEVQVRTTLAGE